MDSKEIESKVKEIGKKVAEVSKSAFDKASDKVQDFTDKSILKIDIKKLQVKQNELYKNLGEKVSKILSDEIIKRIAIMLTAVRTTLNAEASGRFLALLIWSMMMFPSM